MDPWRAGRGWRRPGARGAKAFRLESARVVASVLRIVRDIDAAEEIVQEAFDGRQRTGRRSSSITMRSLPSRPHR